MPSLKFNDSIVVRDAELFVFDKDGTLIDAHHYWVSMIQLRAKFLSETYFGGEQSIVQKLERSMGVNHANAKLFPEGPVGVEPRAKIVEVTRLCLSHNGVDINNATVEDCFQEVDRMTTTNIEPLLKLLPGVRAFIKGLYDKGACLAIATTDLSERARLALRALELEQYFEVILGGKDVLKTKPDAEMGIKICQQTGISPDKAVMFGDHDVDLNMANNAGYLAAIALQTGLKGNDFTADYTVNAKNFLDLEVV